MAQLSVRQAVALVATCILVVAAPVAATPLFDEGKLDPTWFGKNLEFRDVDEIDYFWVAEDFSLSGKKLRFSKWEEPHFLGEKAGERDTKDRRLANDLTRNMPEIFAEAFRNGLGDMVSIVESGESVRAFGRIVDCSTGSAAAKFWVGMGAGSGNVTFDLKFVDAKSGKLVAAVHHRVVSGSNLSTTDSKFVKWVDEWAERLAKSGMKKLYDSGKRAKD